MSNWFKAHKEGLRQIAERLVEKRGFGIIGGELYQNVMDTNATQCVFEVTKIPGTPHARIVVADNDPDGFPDLSHAYTLFAPSFKKADPTKAGRFNLGEKYVLAFCTEAVIFTTKGTVFFRHDGEREELLRRKRDHGTVFEATIHCTHERLNQLVAYMRRLIVKPGLTLTVNGETIPHREPFKTITVKLPTEVSNDAGNLSKTVRVTDVDLYEPAEGEEPMLYELGIPVIETGDKWHYDVRQKVPLNTERDNVTPAYLRDVRTFVLNETHTRLTEEDTEATWVNEAASDDKVGADAIEAFRVLKYGEKSVAADPFNPEANAEAVSHGYTVIPKHGLTPGQRENLKRGNFLLSSSAAFPTAGKGVYSDDPNAEPVVPLTEDEQTEGMKRIGQYTRELARLLLGKQIVVLFVKVPSRQCAHGPWSACYGRGHLLGKSRFEYNVGVLGQKWFDGGVTEKVDDLILHELGHEFSGNHLSEDYYRGLTKLGARLKVAALRDPDWFRQFMPVR